MTGAAGRSGLALTAQVAFLLFANGQTTEGTRLALERLGTALGRPSRLILRWGEDQNHVRAHRDEAIGDGKREGDRGAANPAGDASVVSLIPGVFMFQTAAEVIDLVDLGAGASLASLTGVLRDASTALVILLAMAAGLILPKMCFDIRLAPPL